MRDAMLPPLMAADAALRFRRHALLLALIFR